MEPARNALLPPKAVAKEFAVSIGYLAQARLNGTGPRYVKLGKSVRYRRADIDDWIEANLRTSTGAA